MNRDVALELCAETLEACRAAAPGGAHRIELCTSLEVGGLTPPNDLIAAAAVQSALPVHVLLRPEADSSRYSPATLPAMMDRLSTSMERARRNGAAGFVLGLLLPDGQVDEDHTKLLVRQAHPLPVTFHRAFDSTPDLQAALEAVIRTGCQRLLTSGGAPDVLQGAPMLARLVGQANGRIEIAAGGGLTRENAAEVARRSGCRHFHASLRVNRSGETLEQRLQSLARTLAEAQQPAASGSRAR